MVYFDTNVLIYEAIEQDENRYIKASTIINGAIEDGNFFISPLVYSEFIFTLSKLKIIEFSQDRLNFYSKFINASIDKLSVTNAYKKCLKLSSCRNINDLIHLEIANKYCKKMVTFDSDFKNLQDYYEIKVDILK